MLTLNIDGLLFHFPAGWLASKYDEWSFYRKHFSRQRGGIKAVDVLALSAENIAYLIEVKDYRHPDTERPSALPTAIADKVLHTLAALLPAKLNANEPAERALCKAVLGCLKLRVVAHIEQPARHSPIVDPADIQQQLKRMLRGIDEHPKVVCTAKPGKVGWSVAC